jgi:hypothetical protein
VIQWDSRSDKRNILIRFVFFSTSSPVWSTSRMFIPQHSFNISKCSTSSDPILSDFSNSDETQLSIGKKIFFFDVFENCF